MHEQKPMHIFLFDIEKTKQAVLNRLPRIFQT